jgi:hypothetical protein
MPLEPPFPVQPHWAIEAFVLLRAVQAVLRRVEQESPEQPAIAALTVDVGAMLTKLETLARPKG